MTEKTPLPDPDLDFENAAPKVMTKEETGEPLIPAPAKVIEFANVKAKILYYLSEAEYLSTAQIIELCFFHLETEGSRKSKASRALSELVDAGKIREQWFANGKLYSLKAINPTDHNLAVRDIYVKIRRSPFAVARVNFFCKDVAGLTPDLTVDFGATNGSRIRTYWEYDTGTEGIEELLTKLQRYGEHQLRHRICFVVPEEPRREKLMRHLAGENISFVVLSQFQTLADAAFATRLKEKNISYFSL